MARKEYAHLVKPLVNKDASFGLYGKPWVEA